MGADVVIAALHALPSLEPILGAALAINLAYLNLPKFQYVSIVKERISQRLSRLDTNVRSSVCVTPWYRQLEALSSVDALELEWPRLNKLWISSPGLWGALYNFFFYWRIGRTFSLVATAYALTLLIVGVGHSSGAMSALTAYFDSNIERHFFWASVSVLWPIITVIAGEYVCLAATRFVNYQTQNLQQEALNSAEQAVVGLDQALDAANIDAG